MELFTFIAQTMVMTEENKKYILRYYLITKKQDNILYYGIKISQQDCNFITHNSMLISTDKNKVLEIIRIYADNFVFPESLNDLIDDWMQEGCQIKYC